MIDLEKGVQLPFGPIIFNLLIFYLIIFFLLKLITRFMTNIFWPFVDAFEEWHHLFEGVQYETIVYSNHKKLLIFDDNSSFKYSEIFS
jgi:hypothetical protein